ncbi:ankyrin repeat protein [Apiospora marii]|uniref:Ankyrin repeat protein n=2 Tax=Apiospora marii TaxID=335849 RepID=A0ABR1R9D4_9PEZI
MTRLTTLLWDLCKSGKEHTADYLIHYGADVNAYESGRTPLHAAIHYGRPRLVRILVERGARLDLPDEDGHTPLHLAELEDRRDMVAFLLTHGADELAEDREGRTPWQLNRWNRTKQKRRTSAEMVYFLEPATEPDDQSLLRTICEARGDEEVQPEGLSDEEANHNYTWKEPEPSGVALNDGEGPGDLTAPSETRQDDCVAAEVLGHDRSLPLRGEGVV